MDLELHVTGKKLGWAFCLQAIWILATISILQIGLGTCSVAEEACFQAGQTMSAFMFTLTFPSGILFVLSSEVMYGWGSIHSAAAYFLFWLGFFLVGLVQWLVLIPRIFESNKFTSLGLSAAKPSLRTARRRRKRRSRIKPSPAIEVFDVDGSTPVERIFKHSNN